MGTASTMASHRRGARHDRCRAARRSRPSMPTGCAPPRRPARAAMRARPPTRLTPDRIVTPNAVENALRVLLAIGGSTNAVMHLTAIAGRAGIDLDLNRLNEISDATPVLVDLKPTGPHYMEDLFAAGGIGAVLRELQPLLPSRLPDRHRRDAWASASAPSRRRPAVDREVIRPLAEPLQPAGGLVALFGSLAPKGAIFKRSAADAAAVRAARAGPSSSPRSRISSARIDDPGLDVTPDDFLVLQNAGPLSALGHAGGRLPADPGEARARRGQGHGAHLRRADERHRLRHDRAARDAGRGDRRARSPRCATATASGSRSRSAASTFWLRPTSWRAARRRAAGARARLARLYRPRDPAGRPRLRFRFPAQAAAGDARV